MIRPLTLAGLLSLGLATAAFAEAKSASTPMDFRTCIASIDSVSRQLGAPYSVIVSTDIMRMVRFSTADGSVLITCSKPDRKRVMTLSSHR